VAFAEAPGAAAPPVAPDEQALERRLAALEREESLLEQKLGKEDAELRTLRQRVVARGRAYYRLSRGGLPQDGWYEHAIRVERLRQALLTDLKRARALSQSRREQNERLTLVRERKAPLALESQNLVQVKNALLSQAERERAFQQAFSDTRGVGHTAIYGAGVGLSPGGEDGFGEMRGRLPFPLPGRAEIEHVRRPYAEGPGLVMRAATGTVVRSVFDGRVAFADEYADYGKTIILDHGDGYFTVSANLGSIEVHVGEELTAGSRIGLVGVSQGRGGMYFEVRRGTETLAPGDWFGI
jgi:septal ring factor EnvC (AmiA/AmiB activator)